MTNDNSIAVDDPMQENTFLEDLDGVFGGDSTEEGVADELLQADSGTRQPQDEGATSGNHSKNNPLSLPAAPAPLHSRSDGENSDGSQQEIVSSSSSSAIECNKNNDSGSAAASTAANATDSATSATKATNTKDIGEDERKRELRQRRSSLDTQGAEKGLPPPTWHSEAADKHHRQEMIMEIALLLSARKKNQPTNEWIRQLPHKARRLEDKLYRTASSLEAYLNRATLKRRLRNIARSISSQHHRLSKLNGRSSMSSKRPSVSSNRSSISSLGSLDSFLSAVSDSSKSTSTEQRRVSFLPLTGLNLDSVEPIQKTMIPNNNALEKQKNSSLGTSQQQLQSSVANESLRNLLMQQLIDGNNNNSDSSASRRASSSERNNALSNNTVPIVNNNINNNNTPAPTLPVNSSMSMPGQLVQHDSVSELERQKAVNAKLQEQIIKDLRQQEARVQELLQGRGNKSQQKGGQAVPTVQPISNNIPNSRTSAAVSVTPTTTMTPLHMSNNHAALHSQPATPAVSALANNMQGNNIISNSLQRQQANQNAIAVSMQQQQGNRNALAMTGQQQGNQKLTVQQNLHALQLAQFGGASLQQQQHLAAMLLNGGINAGTAPVATGKLNVGGVAATAGQLNVGAAAGVVPNLALVNQLAAGPSLQPNPNLFSSPGLPLHQQIMFSGHTGGATTAVSHQQNALQQQQNNASATTGRVGKQPAPIVPGVASGPSISSGFDPTMPPPKNKLQDEIATDSFDDSEVLSSTSFAW